MLKDDHFHAWLAGAADGLVRYAYLCCGDQHEAEELVADAVARLWPTWRTGRVENPDGYVRRMIANKLTDRRRRNAVRRRVEARLATEPTAADAAIDHRVDALTMWPLVLALPPGQRAVIVLRFYEARSEAEIAQLLDVPAGTVKSRASRALETLRTQLREVPHG